MPAAEEWRVRRREVVRRAEAGGIGGARRIPRFADLRRQGNRSWLRFDIQLFVQKEAAPFVLGEGFVAGAVSRQQSHHLTVGGFVERVVGQPLGRRFHRFGERAVFCLIGAQPLEDGSEEAVEAFALAGGPFVEGGRIVQEKAGEEVAAIEGKGVL